MKNENLINNIITQADSYKFSHYEQYPENTKSVFSYIESRGSDISDKIMMFGVQYFIKKYLSKPITQDDINFAEKFAALHGEPFNKEGWEYILKNYNGYLPIKIKSLKEGTVVPTHNVMLTVENTDPNVAWITSFIETMLLRGIWYPSTVATVSYTAKKIIYSFLKKTSDSPENEIWFKLQDFGARGVSSLESAGIGGAAHLVNFKGSDTISGIMLAMEYYNAGVCGFSIPAAEHSTTTIKGRDGEFAQMERMVDKFAKRGKMFAVVSDSYDIYNAVENYWCKAGLLKRVKNAGAIAVIRPDSGDPTKIPVELIEMIMKHEGYYINTKGYRVLPDYVRIIQGDGMNLKTIEELYTNLERAGLSASNVTVGMGGGLLQKLDRDTFKWAMKASYANVDGVDIDVYKDPITDTGKRSKKGKLTCVLEGNGNNVEVVNKRINEVKNTDIVLLNTVYDNGPIEEAYETFDVIRERAHNFIVK